MISTCITVAGSDCSGGAGVQADLKVFTAHSVYGMSAVTAITSQNTIGVNGVHLIPASYVEQQISACLLDVHCEVMKTGMLFNQQILKVIVESIDRFKIKKVVVDPLIATRKGALLVMPDYLELFVKELIPRAEVLIPNIAEALIILKHMTNEFVEIHHLEDVKAVGKKLIKAGCKNVVIRCDDIPFASDFFCSRETNMPPTWYLYVLCTSEGEVLLPQKWLASKTARGTSCALSSAVASNLAIGLDLVTATQNAVSYTQRALEMSFHLGRGANSLDYASALTRLPYEKGEFINFVRYHPSITPKWLSIVNHPFVEQLKAGTLSRLPFQKYLVLKYHMLINNAQAAGMMAFSSSSISAIEHSAKIIQAIKEENVTHLRICEQYGLSASQITKSKPEIVKSHSLFIHDTAQQDGLRGIQIAMLPFVFMIQEVVSQISASDVYPYVAWVEHCKDKSATSHIETLLESLETNSQIISLSKVQHLLGILEKSLDFERLVLDTSSSNESSVF